MKTTYLNQPNGEIRLGDFLEQNLDNPKWTSFQAAVAFVRQAGVRHLEAALIRFLQRADVKITVGIDFGGTSIEGLSRLHDAIKNQGEIWIFYNEIGSTFHPKVYVFRNTEEALIAVGSGNFTEGGLYTNYEANLVLMLDLKIENELAVLQQIENSLESWRDADGGLAQLLTDELLDRLAQSGYLPPEVYSREAEEGSLDNDGLDSLFSTVPVKAAPLRSSADSTSMEHVTVFYMTLHLTDVGTGQVTPGAQPRSPEIFIPLSARNAAPQFWDWPTAFTEDASKPGKMDRSGVPMLIGTNVGSVNMMTWPDKHDFRLRSEAIRSGGRIGDIIRIEKTDGSAGYLYIVTIIPQGSAQFATAKANCINSVKNSTRKWGYL